MRFLCRFALLIIESKAGKSKWHVCFDFLSMVIPFNKLTSGIVREGKGGGGNENCTNDKSIKISFSLYFHSTVFFFILSFFSKQQRTRKFYWTYTKPSARYRHTRALSLRCQPYIDKSPHDFDRPARVLTSNFHLGGTAIVNSTFDVERKETRS